MRPSSVEQDRAAVLSDEIPGSDLPAVDQRERQPVGQHRPQFLHQVEREARASRPVAVQEADRRIEADALGRAAAVVGQQRVEKGQQRVDRIERRTARAPVEAMSASGDADQIVEHARNRCGRLAFGAAQNVGSVVGEADALQDHAEPVDGGLDRLAPVRGELLPMIAQRPQQDRRAGWRSCPRRAADDLVGRVGDAILLPPQENVAADRPFDAGLKASGPVEQDDRDAGARAGLDQRRRHIDRAEDDDGAEHVKRHARPLGAVDFGDEVLAVLAQARAFGGDVERC